MRVAIVHPQRVPYNETIVIVYRNELSYCQAVIQRPPLGARQQQAE
jgi:hypothetical protein